MNELKITDVVDQKAFEQLERLKSELDSTFAAYKKAGDAMAEGLKIKPGSVQRTDKQGQGLLCRYRKSVCSGG